MCFLAWLFKVTNKISRLKGCLTITTHLHCVLGLIATEMVGTPGNLSGLYDARDKTCFKLQMKTPDSSTEYCTVYF